MSYLLKIKGKKNELFWTFVLTSLLVVLAVVMFLYNRYMIYVKNLESSYINLSNHLNYTYRDRFYGDINIDYDVNTNTYIADVDFYMPNQVYTFNLSSRGYVIGDGYLHNNKDNLMSHRFARQLRESLIDDFKIKFPEIFKVYVEMQVLKDKYEYKTFYSKEINEPHVVHIYLTSKGLMSQKKFLDKVDEIGKFLIESGYKNLNNVHVNYVVRKEAPALYYKAINFNDYATGGKK